MIVARQRRHRPSLRSPSRPTSRHADRHRHLAARRPTPTATRLDVRVLRRRSAAARSRSSTRAPGVLNVQFTPDTGVRRRRRLLLPRRRPERAHASPGSSRSPCSRPPTRAPTASDGTAEAEAGVATPIALDAVRRRSRPDVGRRPVVRRSTAGGAPVTLAGRRLVVSPPIDATGQHLRHRLHGHRQRRRRGVGQGHGDGDRTERARRRPPWPTQARTTQGDGDRRCPCSANDIDPARPGPDASSAPT